LKVKLFAVCLFLLLTAVPIMSIMTTRGVGEGQWITSYTIENSQTGQLLMEVNFDTGTNTTYAPILAGTDLTVTFTVNVFTSGSGNLRLSTSMQKSSLHAVFWELVTLNYSLGDWNPNSAAIDFPWAKGTLTMVCYGKVPTSAVSNKPVQFNLVQLSSPGGEVLDNIKPYVVNAQVDEYQTLLAQKEDKLQSLKDNGVAPAYVELFSNVIDQAKAEAAQGYVDNAVALLHSLDVSNEPISSTMETLFLPIIVVLAALAVVFGFVFMRARGKIKYVAMVLEDQIKDLEGLTLRASKIDRTLSSSLDGVKDRLKSLVGM
jgi:uncharacterized protein YceK